MSRLEPQDWECPICHAAGDCIECASLHTREDYYRVQELHQHAIEDENGIAARVLENIAALPDLRDRKFWVSRMIDGALRQSRAA